MKFSSGSNKLEIEIDEIKYQLRKPTMADVEAMEEMVKDAEEKKINSVSASIEWVSNLGVDKEVLKKLEPSVFKQLVEYLTGSLKKN